MPTFAQVRRSARAVRKAPHGSRVVNTLRPRGAYAIIRSRGPLSLVLYVAAREDRLVWRNADSFAVLDPPPGWRRARSGRTGPLPRFLGLVERRWELAVSAAVAASTLIATLLVIPFRALWPLITLPVAACSGFFALTMVLVVARGAADLVIHAIRPRRADRTAAQDLPEWQWSMPMCHQLDPAYADDLIRQISVRLRKLVASADKTAGGDLGGSVSPIEFTETLVCLTRGVTTDEMISAIRASRTSIQPHGEESEVAFIAPGVTASIRPRPMNTGRFFLLYLVSEAIIVAIDAHFIAGWEASACDGDCARRPTTYARALIWLVHRLMLVGPSDGTRLTGQSQFAGWSITIMALTTIPVGFIAAVRERRARDLDIERTSERIDDAMRQPLVLLLVATTVERDALLAAVREASQETAEREYLPYHTVFRAGTVGGARIYIAQCEPGMLAPGASTLTALAVIKELRPDYLILSGICYGLRQDAGQQIGDVLVASELRVTDPKKVVDGASRTPVEIPRGGRVASSVTLLDRFRSSTFDWVDSGVHHGLMLSSNTLMNSRKARARLIASEPDAIGGEMEGGGVYAAAEKMKVDWILVKSIADWGADKVDRHQELAARNAARFVVHTIRAGGLSMRPVK